MRLSRFKALEIAESLTAVPMSSWGCHRSSGVKCKCATRHPHELMGIGHPISIFLLCAEAGHTSMWQVPCKMNKYTTTFQPRRRVPVSEKPGGTWKSPAAVFGSELRLFLELQMPGGALHDCQLVCYTLGGEDILTRHKAAAMQDLQNPCWWQQMECSVATRP